ncbi:ABC transporter ATP-binding protein [Deinococcus cellulosilyticus]|uniref:ABC transporter ATP-binding protein n=1 Tax=Deinococcus cellulosilyticus (strain DSM 18568 / NBRC 106333 / KACC 11606 / 5516J-15) TaxID=1223518 RepID=A0A511N020_DEIC1|nr:ABC transporter ATP-binding protein [Deinococcus cellulosilyticus]GEM46173.1 ABC transporter ATP-binding protein [Deinococcus cellulosilyticus NBRC 106333 = KACC 11606]
MTVVLKAVNLSKTFTLGNEQVHALRKVTLDIPQGSFVAVMGPSGSGKSTLLNLLGLLDHPDQGDVVLSGTPTRGLKDDALTLLRREKIGFIFQTFELIPTLSAEENILLTSELSGQLKQARSTLPALAERLGLTGRLRNRPSELSGGQRQRVAIARALINRPSVILADEPTGNLDSRNGREVLEIFQKGVTEEGWTVVMVTHDPAAALCAEKIIFLRDGEIVGETRTASPDARARIEEFVGV